ncbi:DUF992 domain-containing protein [Rhizobium sp. BK251]|uniref:DUF992 domain-containing protein n=1 Tax=Rhizobium sp. BK251 TaxID=2512125 RepID=UPI0010D1AFE5|nr:DUF992 domain-containing protein [Rhizobium sp. BK251]TCL70265.1 uncharacterized protein DUF992 [Rhizobium sp. BK251]
MTTISKLSVAALMVSGVALGTPVFAADHIKTGSLECTAGESVGLVVESTQQLKCDYVPLGGGSVERYSGKLETVGLDIGEMKKEKMVWAVFAPAEHTAGALQGDYIGADADAGLGLGGGAKVLVGGSLKSISLQPVSVDAQKGIDLVAGISNLQLTLDK